MTLIEAVANLSFEYIPIEFIIFLSVLHPFFAPSTSDLVVRVYKPSRAPLQPSTLITKVKVQLVHDVGYEIKKKKIFELLFFVFFPPLLRNPADLVTVFLFGLTASATVSTRIRELRAVNGRDVSLQNRLMISIKDWEKI